MSVETITEMEKKKKGGKKKEKDFEWEKILTFLTRRHDSVRGVIFLQE